MVWYGKRAMNLNPRFTPSGRRGGDAMPYYIRDTPIDSRDGSIGNYRKGG